MNITQGEEHLQQDSELYSGCEDINIELKCTLFNEILETDYVFDWRKSVELP